MKYIKNANIFDGKYFVPQRALSYDSKICDLLKDYSGEAFDAQGMLLIPGFIDLHTHGMMGVDCMSKDAIPFIAKNELKFGTTSFCPTAVSEFDEPVRNFLSEVKSSMNMDTGARVLGAYLEGPYLAPSHRGAHEQKKLRAPQLEHYKKVTEGLESCIVRVTLAPELEGSMDLIEYLSSKGVMVSIGHSSATNEQVLEAVEKGAHSSTHTFNAMPPMHHRNAGIAGMSIIDDRIVAEFIADLIHVEPHMVRLIYIAKGHKNCFACTDSMSAAGMPDGEYKLGSTDVKVENGQARIGSTLAGSTLTMDNALKNLVKAANIPLEHALRIMTYNPARAINRIDLGRLTKGAHADMVLLDEDLNVRYTFVRGNLEYAE